VEGEGSWKKGKERLRNEVGECMRFMLSGKHSIEVENTNSLSERVVSPQQND
jgi:hypothetical protein